MGRSRERGYEDVDVLMLLQGFLLGQAHRG